MAKKQKIHSTTQDFTEIVDIIDDIVFFKGKRACSIIEVSSVNFFLLSADEQNARIYGYMSLLNSLSFAIQIVIVSKKIDLSSYTALLDQKIAACQNPRIQEHLTQYSDFIKQMVKGEGLLDKKTYIVIPMNVLEMGAFPHTQSAKNKNDFTSKMKDALISKRNSVLGQVERMGLSTRPLTNDELIAFFYEQFNQELITSDFNSMDVKNIVL